MAMTTCRECEREVSTAAKTCPGCGVLRPDAEQARRGMHADIARVVVISVAVLALLVLLVTALGV
jgi:RNA polymerase subunit RPABC4/transcription elongation factor Spt4